MGFVTVTQPVKRSRIVPDDHRVHALGDGHLPGVVFTPAIGGPALAQGCLFGLLTPNGLPAKRPQGLANGGGIRRALQHLGRSYGGNPKLGSAITPKPSVSGSGLSDGNLVEIVDDER